MDVDLPATGGPACGHLTIGGEFNMLGERAASGAVLIRRAMGKFCRPSRKEAYLLRSGG
jgi:hypothetical protein